MQGILHQLMLLQEREGWLSESGLHDLADELGVPLHRLESVSTFYAHFDRSPPPAVRVDVCRDLACALAGGADACHRARAALAGRDEVAVREVSCLGRCDAAPAAAVGHGVVDLSDIDAVRAAIEDDVPEERPQRAWAADLYDRPDERWGALRAALRGERHAPVRALEEAGLRGMGGAAFPTARKWAIVAEAPGTPRYVVCNADESEPGTFKDRDVLHDLPHLVIEGMALAARCVGAEHGWIFIRHEYEPERRRLEAALAEARAVGALGPDVFGSGFRFDVEIFVSPGGYILGEETALLECLEDRRGEPRNKPPFPGTRGLRNRPTLINNPETFVHAVGIAHRGADWWRSLGRRGRAGHKFMSVSGDVAKPGVALVPFGTTLGELLEQCGGMRDGQRLLAVAPGGASSNFLPADRLDVPIDFDAIAEAGSMLGTGAAIFVSEDRDLLEVGRNVTRFFANESCGKCVPCRVGTEKAVAMLTSGRAGDARERLEELHATLQRTSICGLGQVALGPVLSIFENFPDRVRG